MNASSDGSVARERPLGGMQPHSVSRLEPGPSPEAELPASAGAATTELRASVLELLGRAIRSARNPVSADGTDAATTDAVRSVCAMARANEVRAETLILAIKTGWRQLPEAHGTTRIDAEVTLAALITLCIREYYAPQRRR